MFDSWSSIRDLEIGPVAGAQAAESDLDADPFACLTVLDAVIAQIPHDLMQVAGIEADFQIVRLFDEPDTSAGNLHGLAELPQELLDPVTEREARGLGRLTAGELQYIVDDGANTLGVAADDVGQPALLGSDVRALGEQLAGVAHGADGIADFMR